MNTLVLEKLCDNPELAQDAAQWFCKIWDIPVEAYYESIQECIDKQNGIPQWYVVLGKDNKIVAGAGIIENDFHNRKDLAPNLCALYVEPPYRKRGVARHILNFARRDLKVMGFEKLYLVTDHTELYEKLGWDFFDTVKDNDGNMARMYCAFTI